MFSATNQVKQLKISVFRVFALWVGYFANSNQWQTFGVRIQGVLLDLSLTGPYTKVCAGILRLSISMGKQFSIDYLTVGPIFMQLLY